MDDPSHKLRSHPAFQALSKEEIEALIAASEIVSFKAGDLILKEGEASDSAIFVLGGQVAIEVMTTYGPVTLATLSGTALLGEIGVFTDLPRTATVRAGTDGQALRIPLAVIQEASRANPALLQYIIVQLGTKIRSFNQAIGFYTNALAALESQDHDIGILDDLLSPPPELTNFAITFRKLADQITQRRVHLREMANAAAIQRAMLPAPGFQDPQGRLDFHAEFRPARDVGGDFYDIFRIDEDRIAITVGDVSGKGVPASLFMAICQTVMRLVLREDADLGKAVSRASDLLDADNAESMFATFFGAVLNLATGELVYCNCGHNPPLLMRRGGAPERLIAEPPEPPLATWSPSDYGSRVVSLDPGDRLLIYTDGMTESHDLAMEEFGEERLLALALALDRHSAREVAVEAIKAVDAFTGTAPQFDDLTCLALTYRP